MANDPAATNTLMDLLTGILLALPGRDIVIVGGDFNTTLLLKSERVLLPVGAENDNFIIFEDLMERCDLIPINAIFQKPKGKLITGRLRRTNNCRTRLDYMCVKNNWRNVVSNCHTLRPVVIVSDHKLVILELLQLLIKLQFCAIFSPS